MWDSLRSLYLSWKMWNTDYTQINIHIWNLLSVRFIGYPLKKWWRKNRITKLSKLTLRKKRWPTLPKSMTNRFAILIGWLSIQSEVVLSCSVEIRLILWERVWHKCSFKFKFNPLFTVWSKSLSLNINLSSFESKIGLKPRQRKSDFSILRARIEHLTSESNQRTFVRTFRNLFKMLKEVTVSIYN